MKNFFYLLYYKIFKLQERVGNSDIAPISSSLMIGFILNLYFVGSLFLLSVLFDLRIKFFENKLFNIILMLVILFITSIFFLNNSKYKIIIEHFDKITSYQSKKANLLSISFAVVGFVLYIIGICLKILQNKGLL